ncbi:hypothetical protein IAT40_005116 [Kwoniella sp. CBS 6097]
MTSQFGSECDVVVPSCPPAIAHDTQDSHSEKVKARANRKKRDLLIESLSLPPWPKIPAPNSSAQPLDQISESATHSIDRAKTDSDEDGAMIVSPLNDLENVRAELTDVQQAHSVIKGDLGHAQRVIRELHRELQLLLERETETEAKVGISGDVVASLAYRLAQISLSSNLDAVAERSCSTIQCASNEGDAPLADNKDQKHSCGEARNANACDRKERQEHDDTAAELGHIASSLLQEADKAAAAAAEAAAQWKTATADKMLASAKAKAKAQQESEELDRVIASAMEHIDEADASDDLKKRREDLKRQERDDELKRAAWSEGYEQRLFNLEGVFEILANRVETLELKVATATSIASRTGSGIAPVQGAGRGEMAQLENTIFVGFSEDEDEDKEVDDETDQASHQDGIDLSGNEVSRGSDPGQNVESRLGRLESGFQVMSGRVDAVQTQS